LYGDPPVADESAAGPEVLFREVPCFPPFSEIENGELFSLALSNKTAGLTHGLHRFPAKYISRVPAWVIDQFAAREHIVLDPFCGSGTTLVEALSRSKKVIGIDCDPLACMITAAKTSAVRPSRIEELGQCIRHSWLGPAEHLHLPMPGLVNFNHWFSLESWGYLQSLLTTITDLKCSREEREFLLCIFSSIIRWVSNADDQTQKTYVSGTLKKNPPAVAPTFWRAFDRALTGLKELAFARLPKAQSVVIRGDASNILLPPGSVDLVVTSPPYLDSVDYMYNFMLEYFWLGQLLGVEDRRTFNQMRREVTGAKKPIGTNHPHLPGCLKDLITEDDIDINRISAARAYCENMSGHFISVARTMKKNARYVLVIGNSQTRKGVLPIHDSLIRLAADAGLAFEKAFAYRIRRHYMKFPRSGRGGIITMDWVIVLRNTQEAASYPDRLPLPDFTLGDDEVAN
jgi:hypothetical protein